MKKIIYSLILTLSLLLGSLGAQPVFAETGASPSVDVEGQYQDNGYNFIKIVFSDAPDTLSSLELGTAPDGLDSLDRFGQFSFCDIYNKTAKVDGKKTIYVCLQSSQASELYISYKDTSGQTFIKNMSVSPSIAVTNDLSWDGYDAADESGKLAIIKDNLAISDSIAEVSNVLSKYNDLKGNSPSFNSSRAKSYRYPSVVLYEKSAEKFAGDFDEEMTKTLLFTSFNDSTYFGDPLASTLEILESANYNGFSALSETEKYTAATALRLYNDYNTAARDEIDPFLSVDDFFTIYNNALTSSKTATNAGITTFEDGTDSVSLGASKNIVIPSAGPNEKTIFDSTNPATLRAGEGTTINDGKIYGIKGGLSKIVYLKVDQSEENKGKIISYSLVPLKCDDSQIPAAYSYRQEAGKINQMIVAFYKEVDVTPASPDGETTGDVWTLDQLADSLEIGDTSIPLDSSDGKVQWITKQVAKVSFPATDISEGEKITLNFKDSLPLDDDEQTTIGDAVLTTEPTVSDTISPVGKIVTKTGKVTKLEVIFNELIPEDKKTDPFSSAITKIALYKESGSLKGNYTSKVKDDISWSKRDGRDVMTIDFASPVTVDSTNYFKIDYTDLITDYAGNKIDTKSKSIAVGGGITEPEYDFTYSNGTASILNEIREMAGGKTPKVAITSSSSEGYEDSADYYMSRKAQAAYGFAIMGMEPVMGGITVDVYDDPEIIDETIASFEDCTGMFGPGGDQAMNSRSYLNDDGSDTEQMRGLRQIFYSGGVISGSSAGDHSLSNPMLNGGASSEAIKDNRIEFSTVDDWEAVPTGNVPLITPGFGFLQDYGLTDSHVDARGRLGRILVALKHIPEEAKNSGKDGITVTPGIEKGIGIGVDENTAISVVDGVGHVVGASGVMISDISGATFPNTTMFTAKNVKLSYLTAGDQYNFETKKVTSSKNKAQPSVKALSPSENIFPGNIKDAKISGPEVLMRDLINSTTLSNYGKDRNNSEIVLNFTKDKNTEGFYSSPEAFTISQMNLDVEVNTPPAPVTSISASLYSKYNSIKVSWGKVSGATGYTVDYKEYGGSWKALYSGTSTSYTKTSLKAGKRYDVRARSYRMVAGNKVYSTKYSLSKYVYTLKAPTVKLSKSGSKSIKVSWTNIPGETGYQVYRATKSNGKYYRVKTLSYKSSSFTDPKKSKGQKYYYKVRAFKNTGGGKYVYGPFSTVKYIKR